MNLGQTQLDKDYFKEPGLSFSGMKDLAVSPLRYWYLHVRPDREPREATDEMVFGTALHCATLEPNRFTESYARELVQDEFPGCLRTTDDLRAWLRDMGHTPKGTRKAELVAQVQAFDAEWPILDVLEAAHAEANKSKVILPAYEFARVRSAAESLLSEPRVQELLEGIKVEHSLFRRDSKTGVQLKGRPDGMQDSFNLDVKTFSQRRGISIDESVNQAIWYEKYHWQGVHYAMLRGWPDEYKQCRHILIFVESDPPHEVRIKVMQPTSGGQANLLWERARVEIQALTRIYQIHADHFGLGDRPWRYAQEQDILLDEEIRALAFL